MADTFTCDSCGKNNVPDADKKQILMKQNMTTGKTTPKGKPQMSTVTDGMDVCPDCIDNGIKRNHAKVSKEGESERFFTWNPQPNKHSAYEWGNQKQGQEAQPAQPQIQR